MKTAWWWLLEKMSKETPGERLVMKKQVEKHCTKQTEVHS